MGNISLAAARVFLHKPVIILLWVNDTLLGSGIYYLSYAKELS